MIFWWSNWERMQKTLVKVVIMLETVLYSNVIIADRLFLGVRNARTSGKLWIHETAWGSLHLTHESALSDCYLWNRLLITPEQTASMFWICCRSFLKFHKTWSLHNIHWANCLFYAAPKKATAGLIIWSIKCHIFWITLVTVFNVLVRL